jgi:hypothetical protein
MAHAKAVHRPLSLATPHLKGADVKALQGSVNGQFEHLKIDRRIKVDGELGAQTFTAAKQVARCLGVVGSSYRKLKRGHLSESAQKLIRGRKLSKGEAVAAKVRAPYRRKLRKRYAKAPGERAIERSADLVGVHEEPPGSNWGRMVGKMIRFTGYSGPVYWCGCCAAWIVIKLGGARIPSPIRLGYAPYITADALAGANGLTAVPVDHARAGDLGCLWGGEHVVTVRGAPRNGMVPTREGNTSASDGSQSNGGEVADKERPIGDFDRGIVARPNYA